MGTKTPLHHVFAKPLRQWSDLLDQVPLNVDADGDGTVLAASALGDEFPDYVVQERVVVEGFKHAECLSSPKLWEIIARMVSE